MPQSENKGDNKNFRTYSKPNKGALFSTYEPLESFESRYNAVVKTITVKNKDQSARIPR